MQNLSATSTLRLRGGRPQAMEAGADKAACSGALEICFGRVPAAGAPAMLPRDQASYKAAMLVLEQVRSPMLPKSGLW